LLNKLSLFEIPHSYRLCTHLDSLNDSGKYFHTFSPAEPHDENEASRGGKLIYAVPQKNKATQRSQILKTPVLHFPIFQIPNLIMLNSEKEKQNIEKFSFVYLGKKCTREKCALTQSVFRHFTLWCVVEAFSWAIENHLVGDTFQHQTRIRMTTM